MSRHGRWGRGAFPTIGGVETSGFGATGTSITGGGRGFGVGGVGQGASRSSREGHDT